MKKILLFTLSSIIISNIIAQTVDSDKNRFSLKTNSNSIKVEIVDVTKEDLELSFSSVKSDTLSISLYLPENNRFKVYSDIDTTDFILPIGHSVILSVKKKENKPIIINLKNGIEYDEINFDKNNKNEDFSLLYENDINSPYLKELKNKYPIDSIASSGNSDLEKVRNVSSWVHHLWKHNGMNEPEKKDALYILEEVKNGKQFRCVEYGIVTTACLNSIGIKARTLSLKTKDVEIRPVGAGHVVLEVFLNDLDKWIVVDPQWDIIPHIDGKPLNAIELQSAITNRKKVSVWTTEQTTSEEYIPWIYPYLYYFSIKFDNRENISKEKQYTYQGKSYLMLVPIGAKNPTIFQQKFPLNYCFYTNSIKDFYRKP